MNSQAPAISLANQSKNEAEMTPEEIIARTLEVSTYDHHWPGFIPKLGKSPSAQTELVM